MSDTLRLSFGLQFADLYEREGLLRLDAAFMDFLKQRDLELHKALLAARASPKQCIGKIHSDLIVTLAPEVEDFLGELLGSTALCARSRTGSKRWRRSTA